MTARSVQSVSWEPTGTDHLPVAKVAVSFLTADTWVINPRGSYAQLGSQVEAFGVTVDNIANAQGVTIQIGTVTYPVPAFSRVNFQFGKASVTQVTIVGISPNIVTVYFWLDPRSVGAEQQDVFGITVQSLSTFLEGYNAAFSGIVLDANPTDVNVIRGSLTKAVNICRLKFSVFSPTPLVNIPWQLIKRRTDDAGGTSTNADIIPVDSNNIASGAQVRSYTINPVGLGIPLGSIEADQINITANTQFARFDVELLARSMQPLTLRGVTEVLALNFGGAAMPGAVVYGSWDWYETDFYP